MTDQPVRGCMACATYRAEGRACPRHRGKPNTPAPSGGGALTDDEWTELDAAIRSGNRRRIVTLVNGFFAARAAQPGTPTAVEALAEEMESLDDPHDPNAAGIVRQYGRRLRAALAQVEAQPDVDRLNREHPLDGEPDIWEAGALAAQRADFERDHINAARDES
jgi:predicted NBD/HSP70 family sugar kinase